MKKKTQINYSKLGISIILCQLAGLIGSIFTFPSVTAWYRTLIKPQFTPQPWVFAPVWTILYLLMGIALYLVWQTKFKKSEVKTAINLFAIQLTLNVTWSFLFFGQHNPFYGLIDIIPLAIAIIATIIQFNKINRNAALLMLPYLAWVLFASYLNYSIWMLNP